MDYNMKFAKSHAFLKTWQLINLFKSFHSLSVGKNVGQKYTLVPNDNDNFNLNLYSA